MPDQPDMKVEAYGTVSEPPDVGLSEVDRIKIEHLAGELSEVTRLRTGVILAKLYRAMQEEQSGARL